MGVLFQIPPLFSRFLLLLFPCFKYCMFLGFCFSILLFYFQIKHCLPSMLSQQDCFIQFHHVDFRISLFFSQFSIYPPPLPCRTRSDQHCPTKLSCWMSWFWSTSTLSATTTPRQSCARVSRVGVLACVCFSNLFFTPPPKNPGSQLRLFRGRISLMSWTFHQKCQDKMCMWCISTICVSYL